MDQVQCIRYREKNKHLSFEERRTLEKLMRENRQLPKEKKLTKTAIAKKMGIHRSTLYRELKCGEIEQPFIIVTPIVLLNADQMNMPMGCSGDTSRRDPILVITLQKLFKKLKTGQMTIREEYLMNYQPVKNYKKISLK